MRHPLETWPSRHRRGAFVVSVAATLVVGFFLAWINADLRTDAAPHAQVSLQMAGSHEAATRIVRSWEDAEVMHKAGLSLGFDYVYLIAYSTAIAAAAAGIAARCRRRTWMSAAGLGMLVAWGAWMAAALDAAENALMVPILTNPVTGGSPGLVKALALTKFSLLALALLYVVAVGLASFRRRPPLFRSASLAP